jgi:hypothetical protein
MLIAALPLMTARAGAPPLASSSGAVFALIDSNEWCPGGSVYVDLRTGSFMLYPRLPRPACTDRKLEPAVEHGTLGAAALHHLRVVYAEARRAGLRRDKCDPVISNGGPQVLVITAPNFSDTTPEELGCWSREATTLHRELFEVFGGQRRSWQ